MQPLNLARKHLTNNVLDRRVFKRHIVYLQLGEQACGGFGGLGSGDVQHGLKALAAFHLAHPGVEVTLSEDSSDRMIEQVRAGVIDLALVGCAAVPPSDLESLSIVSEMLDVGNRELAEVTQADDFIVSDKLISLLMAQVSENKFLNAVFNDLFDSDGSEIYLKPAADYISFGPPVNFHTVVEAARRRGESAIGYRKMAHANDSGKQYGVVVNPKKSQSISFVEGDLIIVVAED